MYPPPKHIVTFLPDNISVQVSEGTDILTAAQRAGIQLATGCGGQRDCGECRVIIIKGKVSSITPEEMANLSENQIQMRNRLACCARIRSAISVFIPKVGPSPATW